MRCRPDCCASQVITLWRYTNTAWTKKVGPHAHDHNSVKSQQIWKKNYWNIYLVKWISKIPPHFAYVATLLCETLMSAINNKLQGSVATYLRCGLTKLGKLLQGHFAVLTARGLKVIKTTLIKTMLMPTNTMRVFARRLRALSRVM